jgi:hypothetical protein
MEDWVHVAMKLRPAARTPEAIARVQQTATGLGLEPTGAGKASLSFRATGEAFERLFGVAARPVDSRPAGAADKGVPGGYMTEADLQLPEELKDDVESVGVLPPARRFR